MSYSFKIKDGDLDLSSSVINRVYGIEKLKQDLSFWLIEEFGIDNNHPNYGSVLNSYIGSVIDADTQAAMEDEVNRVLGIYQQIQLIGVRRNPAKYSQDELLDSIESVKCQLSYDTVYIDIQFTTASGAVAIISESVSI